MKMKDLTRRTFLKTSAATGGVLALAGASVNLAAAESSDTIRVGLVGCGKRGAGAAQDCVKAPRGVSVVALADVFGDRIAAVKGVFGVSSDRCFVGLDAYKKLMALDEVDLVILATPPAFRPVQFAEAVNQGKHVFMAAPVAICSAGVKMVIEASKKAEGKKLAVVAGTQRRHDPAYVETMKRIRGGAIGQIIAAECYWSQGAPPVVKRESGQSDVAWQIRNWRYFTWLSGEQIVEQHVHNIDVINWAFDALPAAVHSLGGRQALSGPEHGNVYDHFGTEFTYDNDVRTISTCRQIDGTDGLIGERVSGTKGASNCAGIIEGQSPWRYQGSKTNAYVQTQADLIRSIRDGKPLNEGRRAAESAMCAVMARESAYSRQQFKRAWFESKSAQSLLPPESLSLRGANRVSSPVVPGQYKLGGAPAPKARTSKKNKRRK